MGMTGKPARISERFPGVEWVEGTGSFISVDTQRCTGCGNCMKVCLGDCFEIAEKKARIRSLDLCMECGSCWYVCAEEAIAFTWPKGGTGFRTRWG
jgi:NAD-dependent dihydropyrimidine dehydrogenase PreA subunit